jgi:hypothetical protein
MLSDSVIYNILIFRWFQIFINSIVEFFVFIDYLIKPKGITIIQGKTSILLSSLLLFSIHYFKCIKLLEFKLLGIDSNNKDIISKRYFNMSSKLLDKVEQLRKSIISTQTGRASRDQA